MPAAPTAAASGAMQAHPARFTAPVPAIRRCRSGRPSATSCGVRSASRWTLSGPGAGRDDHRPGRLRRPSALVAGRREPLRRLPDRRTGCTAGSPSARRPFTSRPTGRRATAGRQLAERDGGSGVRARRRRLRGGVVAPPRPARGRGRGPREASRCSSPGTTPPRGGVRSSRAWVSSTSPGVERRYRGFEANVVDPDVELGLRPDHDADQLALVERHLRHAEAVLRELAELDHPARPVVRQRDAHRCGDRVVVPHSAGTLQTPPPITVSTRGHADRRFYRRLCVRRPPRSQNEKPA